MFQGIDSIAQIIISISILIAVILALIIVWRRGIKLGLKKGIEIPSESESYKKSLISMDGEGFETLIEIITESMEEVLRLGENAAVNRKMSYAEDKFPLMRAILEKTYYRLSKSRVDDLVITDNEDLEYYQRIVSIFLYADNGLDSVKTITRKYIRNREYRNGDFEKFISSFMEFIIEAGRKFFNLYYRSEVTTITGERRKRIVSAKELYDALDEQRIKDELCDIFKDIFYNSKKVDTEVAAEREVLYQRRRNKLRQLVGIEGEKHENDR